MFISDEDKKCLKQKNYKDLEIAIDEFLTLNNITSDALSLEKETEEIASVIEVIYKDVYCDGEDNSDIEDLIIKMLSSKIKVVPPEYTQSDIDYISLKIKWLEKLPQPEQRTPEWYDFRNNRLTASDLWHITNWNESKVHDILKKKCGVEQKYSPGSALLHGIKFEAVATWIYEKRYNVEIIEFGCLPHSVIPYFGASPDGICAATSENKNLVGRMLEIKCPKSRVITGFIPEVYRAQIQGQLEVCDLEYCDYLECDIQVYNSRKDFFDDSFVKDDGTIDYKRTKKGNEKGVLFETLNTDNKSYDYQYNYDEIKSHKQLDKWEEPFIDKILESDNLEHAGTTLWYLNNISVVLVQRDKKWFSKNFVNIKRFWEKVEEARINGIPERKKSVKKLDMSQFTGTQCKPSMIELDFSNK